MKPSTKKFGYALTCLLFQACGTNAQPSEQTPTRDSVRVESSLFHCLRFQLTRRSSSCEGIVDMSRTERLSVDGNNVRIEGQDCSQDLEATRFTATLPQTDARIQDLMRLVEPCQSAMANGEPTNAGNAISSVCHTDQNAQPSRCESDRCIDACNAVFSALRESSTWRETTRVSE